MPYFPEMTSIIPHQEINGNYNTILKKKAIQKIIPHQEINGNYNLMIAGQKFSFIIPHQEINGNYNPNLGFDTYRLLYHTKK